MNATTEHPRTTIGTILWNTFLSGRPASIVIAFGLAGLAVVADLLLGPFLQFPFFFVIPVMLLSWMKTKLLGLTMAVSLPLFRFCFTTFWSVPWTMLETGVNAAIRISVLSILALTVAYAAQKSREVRALKGILPICCRCKRVRDGNGRWHQVEEYVTSHSEAHFSHGYCPECMKQEVSALEKARK